MVLDIALTGVRIEDYLYEFFSIRGNEFSHNDEFLAQLRANLEKACKEKNKCEFLNEWDKPVVPKNKDKLLRYIKTLKPLDKIDTIYH